VVWETWCSTKRDERHKARAHQKALHYIEARDGVKVFAAPDSGSCIGGTAPDNLTRYDEET
jgi:hypothetical protein